MLLVFRLLTMMQLWPAMANCIPSIGLCCQLPVTTSLKCLQALIAVQTYAGQMAIPDLVCISKMRELSVDFSKVRCIFFVRMNRSTKFPLYSSPALTPALVFNYFFERLNPSFSMCFKWDREKVCGVYSARLTNFLPLSLS